MTTPKRAGHDVASSAEREKNRRALEVLAPLRWAKRLVKDSQQDNPKQGILFELRFAYELARLGLVPEYEHATGVEGTSVDFRIAAKAGEPSWNIELVSIERSDAVEKATIVEEHRPGIRIETLDLGLGGESRDDAERIVNKQTPEHEMLRVIGALERKCFDSKKQRPIKFPIPDASTVNMLLVDIRRYEGLGFLDRDHCRQMLGGAALVKHDFNVQWDPGSNQPIRGLWSPDNERPAAEIARERDHVVGFVHEEAYDDDEIREVTVLFQNPKLRCDVSRYPLRWLTPPDAPRTALRQTNALWNDG